MRQVKSLSHTRWECKYHIVFIPKYRRKMLFGQIRQGIRGGLPSAGQAERELGRRRAYDGRSCAHDDIDSTEICSIPGGWVYQRKKCNPYSPHLHWAAKRNYVGQHFWARGYFASTVGRDEQVIREYIRHQEAEDRLDSINWNCM